MKKITIIAICLIILVNLNSFELVKENEKPYKDIDKDFFGNGFSYINNIDSELQFFNGNQNYRLNIEDYKLNIINQKGKGPGEFLSPSKFIKIKNKYICIDRKKYSLIVYDEYWNFYKEKRFEKKPVNIFKISENRFGVLYQVVGKGKLISIFNDKFNKLSDLLDYSDLYEGSGNNEKSSIYNAQILVEEKKIYMFLIGVPIIHMLDLKTGKSEIENYQSQLDFNPTKIFSKKHGDSYSTTPMFLPMLISGKEDNKAFFLLVNRKSIKGSLEDADYYFLQYDLEKNKVSLLENIKKIGPKLIFHSIFIDGKLLVFNDDEGMLSFYKIMENI